MPSEEKKRKYFLVKKTVFLLTFCENNRFFHTNGKRSRFPDIPFDFTMFTIWTESLKLN